MNFSAPFSRIVDACAKLAEKYGGITNPTGSRLADSLEVIAKHGAGVAEKQAASTAADVAGLKADFNALLLKLQNAGVMQPEEFTITVTKDVEDTVLGGGRADRQWNTDQIKSVAESDGVITITLNKPVSELRWFEAGGSWGNHKWLGIGISAGINPITGLKYNGSSLTDADVTEATQVGLSAGYFVRWVAADLAVANDNSQASKDAFTLWADGYGTVDFTIKVVEP